MWVSFVVTCLLAVFIFQNPSPRLAGIIVSSTVMLIFGIIDDWRELSVPAKFLAQIIAASILVFSGSRTNIVYIGNPANIIITFIWVLGITNAFNLLDIMDGLAAGTALIACFSFSMISFINGDADTLVLSLILSGAIIGFLIYNLPPANIYMGNSGSHFLGFVLAAIALVISYASLETKIALLSPLLILGFPILDTIFLIFMRLSKKKLPFNKSNDHLALRLSALGYSKIKVLLIILGLALFFSLCGVIISRVSVPFDAVIIGMVIFVSLVLIKKFSKIAVHG